MKERKKRETILSERERRETEKGLKKKGICDK